MRFVQVYALLTLLGNGCAPSALQTQARAANALALGANETLPLLESAYRAEGMRAIDAAHTEQEATLALVRIRQRWQPVWGLCADDQAGPSHHCHDGAWPALVAAQNAWARALEQQAAGTPLDNTTTDRLFRQIRSAYCDLKHALPAGITLASALVSECNESP